MEGQRGRDLQNHALPRFPVLVALFGEEGRAGCVLKDFSDTLATLGAAFEVVPCADLLLDFLALGKGQECFITGGDNGSDSASSGRSSKLFDGMIRKMVHRRGSYLFWCDRFL